jgi:hypothetical protein
LANSSALKTEAVIPPEAEINFYQAAWHHIIEDNALLYKNEPVKGLSVETAAGDENCLFRRFRPLFCD